MTTSTIYIQYDCANSAKILMAAYLSKTLHLFNLELLLEKNMNKSQFNPYLIDVNGGLYIGVEGFMKYLEGFHSELDLKSINETLSAFEKFNDGLGLKDDWLYAPCLDF